MRSHASLDPAAGVGQDRDAALSVPRIVRLGMPCGFSQTRGTVAMFAGLRRGELLALRWRDVDFDAGAVRVKRSRDHAWRDCINTHNDPDATARVRIRDRSLVGWLRVRLEPRSSASRRTRPGWPRRDADCAASCSDLRFDQGRHGLRSWATDGHVNAVCPKPLRVLAGEFVEVCETVLRVSRHALLEDRVYRRGPTV